MAKIELVRRVNTGAISKRKVITRADLSTDQAIVYDKLVAWCNNRKSDVLKLGGYAGTGKTTLIGLLARDVLARYNVAYCAYTGKAGNMLRQKLSEAGVLLGEPYCGTIHGLIYRPIVDVRTGALIRFSRIPCEQFTPDFVVVDEGSMVGNDIWRDLLSYRKKILVVGDCGQLPPVGAACINLMDKPDLLLEEIHRQAKDNPIIKLADSIRRGNQLRPDYFNGDDKVRYEFGGSLAKRFYDCKETLLEKAVLCFFNRTRVNINAQIRSLRNSLGILSVGDTVICLRNTSVDDVRLFNGMRGIVEKVKDSGGAHLLATIHFVDDGLRLVDGKLLRSQFGRDYTFNSFDEIEKETKKKYTSWSDVGLLFDYGCTLTVHKAQGSQFNEVFLVAENNRARQTPDERKRWLYTGITRAAKRLEIVQ